MFLAPRRRAVEIARRILEVEIAPALERALGPRPHRITFGSSTSSQRPTPALSTIGPHVRASGGTGSRRGSPSRASRRRDSSSARLGTMRVVWTCSRPCALLPALPLLSRIQSSRSLTLSQPTQSLMRCRVTRALAVSIPRKHIAVGRVALPQRRAGFPQKPIAQAASAESAPRGRGRPWNSPRRRHAGGRRAGGLRFASAVAGLGLSVGASAGSEVMMLTAGIESADGKK